ncbi:hypothetical protein H1O16_gp263 [Burkholderia phage BcepSaruman]|uniref:Uncharacterized protein n=1 Tax=Burkholderia phage BcepSaruman TaxID=2530032 RepID=A0A4D5ZDN5_9CAUD|nr:hypothetical protein H1O16_gp263 [Burkholderia phage BcepSaruman]QBX06676.1 hypothetical protein BcepSaruman_263 [Burkholderia phage BcepSaruman]
MTYFNYQIDWPSTDYRENLRLGYRTPRSILCPPYLAINPYYVDYVNAIDNVFDEQVDLKTETLLNLRNMWVTNPTMEQEIVDQVPGADPSNPGGHIVEFDDWSQPERDLLVKQVNALGMKLANAGIISNNSYQAIARWVGMYWYGKGTRAFIDFINYSLSSFLDVKPLWTQDYVHFYKPDDPAIGAKIWEGGTWYPTTHVQIIAKGGLGDLDINTLVAFFYEIANYNLVLYSVDEEFDMPITDDPTLVRTDAQIVALGLWEHQNIFIQPNTN